MEVVLGEHPLDIAGVPQVDDLDRWRDGSDRGRDHFFAAESLNAEQERAMEDVLGEHLLDVARVAQVDDLDRRRHA